MRIQIICCLLIAPLSGCQIASSTHWGGNFAYPERSLPSSSLMPVRTPSIAEQIAPPNRGPDEDPGKPVPTYEPFLKRRVATSNPIRVAYLDGSVTLDPRTEEGGLEVLTLAPIPIVNIDAIRKALSEAAKQDESLFESSALPSRMLEIKQKDGLFEVTVERTGGSDQR